MLAEPRAVRAPNQSVPSGAGRSYVCVDFDALGLSSSGLDGGARPAVPPETSPNLSVSQTSGSLP